MISAIYTRLFKCCDGLEQIVGHPTREQFYERVRKDYQRRIKGGPLITDLGAAASEEHVRGKGGDLFGKRFSMDETVIGRQLETLRPDLPLSAVFCSIPPDESLLERGAVLSYLEQAIAYECKLHQEFAYSITRTSKVEADRAALRQADRKAKWLDWQRRHARDIDRYSHISVGAFREEEARPLASEISERRRREIGRLLRKGVPIARAMEKAGEGVSDLKRAAGAVKTNRACFVPFYIAEIDAQSSRTSYLYARELLVRLRDLGADLASVVVAFSGNRSWHVRIPSGMVGNPIFRSGEVAREMIRAFFRLIAGGIDGRDGPLFDVLDSNLFSPNHLIRAIGSTHETSGGRCAAFSGEDLLESPDLVAQYLNSPSSFRIADPTEVEIVPELVAAMQLAAEEPEASPDSTRQDTHGIIAAIRDGVEIGEEFYPGHVGRNKAALFMAHHLLRRHSRTLAWERFEDWNRLNRPPLGEHPSDERHVAFPRFRG